jgi:hypothetical protein
MKTRITCVTVDCANPQLVAAFWNEALRWGGVEGDENSAICGPPRGGIYLEFIRVPAHKTEKNRLHLGCSAGTLEELDHELERLLALGATFGWEEEFDPEIAAHYRNLVLRDPEGNEFCLGGGSWAEGD